MNIFVIFQYSCQQICREIWAHVIFVNFHCRRCNLIILANSNFISSEQSSFKFGMNANIFNLPVKLLKSGTTRYQRTPFFSYSLRFSSSLPTDSLSLVLGLFLRNLSLSLSLLVFVQRVRCQLFRLFVCFVSFRPLLVECSLQSPLSIVFVFMFFLFTFSESILKILASFCPHTVQRFRSLLVNEAVWFSSLLTGVEISLVRIVLCF